MNFMPFPVVLCCCCAAAGCAAAGSYTLVLRWRRAGAGCLAYIPSTCAQTHETIESSSIKNESCALPSHTPHTRQMLLRMLLIEQPVSFNTVLCHLRLLLHGSNR
jgi:hypothetical protein